MKKATMNTMKRLAVLMLALASTACITNRDMRQWLVWEKNLQVTEVRRSQQCAAADGTTHIYLLPTLADVRSWESGRGIDLSGGPGAALNPEVPYALIDLGQRSSAGYALAVSRMAGRRKQVLTLKATFIEPKPDSMQAQVITSPCVLVSLPPQAWGEVEVIDQAGDLRASSRN